MNAKSGLYAAFGLCAAMALVSGFAHGSLDGRWSSPPALVEIGGKLNTLPEQLGPWKLVEETPLPENAQNLLRCFGSTNRVYRNIETEERINFAVMFGRRGPIAVHTPEVCYTGRGTIPAGERRKEVIVAGEQEHTLWSVSFLSSVDNQPKIDVYYAWSDGSEWIAAENPRFWMTDNLYKIQLAVPPHGEGQESVVTDFLMKLLPELDERLGNAG